MGRSRDRQEIDQAVPVVNLPTFARLKLSAPLYKSQKSY